MNIADFMLVAKEGVSFAVLLVVLFGVYRLTNRMVDVLSLHIERCCDSLERIADALEEQRKQE